LATKLDLKKTLKHLYNPPVGDFTTVDVPAMRFLMVDGQGNPNTAPAYAAALEALYSVAYTLKFMSKREPGIDYGVMPLEGLWWVPDMAGFTMADKDAWLWTAMIMQPDHITESMVTDACAEVRRKKNPSALDRLRFEAYHEGLSVQIMHIGPYSAEGPTLQRMHHEFIPAHGLAMEGKHHEIYLSDPSRTAPEKLRTVLRQPVRGVEGAHP
jgi:hypothetical protein